MRRVGHWVASLGGLFVLWLSLVGTTSDVELIAGLCAAAIGATATEIVRAQGLLRFRVESRWLGRAPRSLARVVPDFFLVLSMLARPRRGGFRTLEFPAGGERAVDHGRRAWAELVGSFAPGRLVVDIDPETGEALVHDLRPRAGTDEVL